MYVNDRLPSLPLPQSQQAYSSGTSSPGGGSLSSSSILNGGSHASSYTTASSNGPKTPSPTLPNSGTLQAPLSHQSSYSNPPPSATQYPYQDPYTNMNQGNPDMYYSSHMSAGQPPTPQTVTAAGMNHYPHHQQPPLLQPGPGQYSPAQNSYGQYGYANNLTSPQQSGHQVSGSMGPQGNVLSLPPMSSAQPSVMPGQTYPPQAGYDTTGQLAPPGMKPRVTATLWEDEGSLCFQVEAKGVCVARREDNHMINGTKLLNVAGMTRGRRDGILKSEKMRHVVKIGPMHLKGVWIPFDRALDFANKEKITELLYPLFVHNIGALLYHPANQNRTNVVMAAAERRKQEQNQLRNSQGPGLPSIQSHHHHSMSMGSGHLPGPQHSLAPHPGVGRPDIQRAHTFPTPPTSASSVMGNMGNSDTTFQWTPQSMSNGQSTGPLAIDTGISNARSMPTTPATTPPGTSVQGMQYQQGQQQSYDASRQMYSGPPDQNAYPQSNSAQQNLGRYSQGNTYVKNEMGPPGTRAPGSGADSEHHGSKGANGLMHHGPGSEQVGQSTGEEEAEHEHDAEYTHDSNSSYDTTRGPYTYAPGPPVGSLAGEHAHIAQEMNGSPNHQGGSGRATPRTAAASQPYYSQQQGYNTPPRVQPPSSNLYNVMSSERGTANGNTASDVYAPQPELGSSMTNGYAPHPSQMNGAISNGKRARDDDDDVGRPSSRGADIDALKRRKTIREPSLPGPTYNASLNRTQNPVTQRRR